MKTKIAKKTLLILLAILAAFLTVRFFQQNETKPQTTVSEETTCLKLSAQSQECEYNLDLADSPSERRQGLSGRDSLPHKNGMLFKFDEVAEQCIWMKDMKFSIDIIWLDEQKKIIKTQTAVSPSTYPNSFCAADSKYVIELDNGDVAASNIGLGQQLIF